MRRFNASWQSEMRPFREVEKISRKREFHFEKNDSISCFGKRSKKSEQSFPLFKLPLHVVERVVAQMSLADMLTFRLCSKKTRSIVDNYWQHLRSFTTSVEEFHRLFPYIDPEQKQFESMFHIRDEVAKVLRMLPKNRLVEADFSGLRRFQRELMEEIMIRSRLEASSLFAGVTTMSFNGCIVSCDDLESLSYCMQNLKSLTLSDRLIDHRINGEDVDAKKIQNFRTYKANGLIGHRGRTISHIKALWPSLVQLTFV
uniref:F-box domain-containing protein n=1 Tax=Haemonchus contortus TaxID=6289 RepID=A0A7I4YAI9_HAECO